MSESNPFNEEVYDPKFKVVVVPKEKWNWGGYPADASIIY
jgi:hypothetical protein